MDVTIIRWPTERRRMDELREHGIPRLVLLDPGATPTITADVAEDWLRLPASPADVRARIDTIAARVDALAARGGLEPVIEDDLVLRHGRWWTQLTPTESKLARTLVEHFDKVVSRAELLRAGWPSGAPNRNNLDVHIGRLRRRLVDGPLQLRTVRSRGYLLTGRHAAG